MQQKGLDAVKINLIQGTAMNLDQVNRMQLQLSDINRLVNKLQESEATQVEQNKALVDLKGRVVTLQQDSTLFNDLSKEVKILFPNVNEMRFARMQKTDFQDTILQMPTYFVRWKSARLQRTEQPKLYDFLKVRTKLDTLELINY
ncbi:MAG: hypothetical protein IPJ74_12975 [Saprospiraceae bacterium]|nr:hypothetical protein [Saprospiraceae bacterium]